MSKWSENWERDVCGLYYGVNSESANFLLGNGLFEAVIEGNIEVFSQLINEEGYVNRLEVWLASPTRETIHGLHAAGLVARLPKAHPGARILSIVRRDAYSLGQAVDTLAIEGVAAIAERLPNVDAMEVTRALYSVTDLDEIFGEWKELVKYLIEKGKWRPGSGHEVVWAFNGNASQWIELHSAIREAKRQDNCPEIARFLYLEGRGEHVTALLARWISDPIRLPLILEHLVFLGRNDWLGDVSEIVVALEGLVLKPDKPAQRTMALLILTALGGHPSSKVRLVRCQNNPNIESQLEDRSPLARAVAFLFMVAYRDELAAEMLKEMSTSSLRSNRGSLLRRCSTWRAIVEQAMLIGEQEAMELLRKAVNIHPPSKSVIVGMVRASGTDAGEYLAGKLSKLADSD